MLLFLLHSSCPCFFIQILFLPTQKKFGCLQLLWLKKLLYAYWSAPSYHMGCAGAKLQNSSSAGAQLHTSFSTTPLLLSHHISKEGYLSFPHMLQHAGSGNKKFTSQQSRILGASTWKEIWYTALGSPTEVLIMSFCVSLFHISLTTSFVGTACPT